MSEFFFLMSSLRFVSIVGFFIMMFEGCSLSKMERGSLLEGRCYLSFRLSATDKMDCFLILYAGRGASMRCLFG